MEEQDITMEMAGKMRKREIQGFYCNEGSRGITKNIRNKKVNTLGQI